MRRDSIFYRLFAQFPQLLFALLDQPPEDPESYRFDSVGVKEPKFEIDGVFLPSEGSSPGTVFFTEVQFQKDKFLYERLFGESFLYFYRNRERFSDWQAIVIYPSRSTEQSDTRPYSDLLNGPRVHRIYLDELGEMEALPLEAALMVLTTLEDEEAANQAKALVARSQRGEVPELKQRAIIEMATTILIYKFTHLSRKEVEAMLGITEVKLEDTRFYQDVKAEGRQEGRQEGRRDGLLSLLQIQVSQKFGSLDERLQAPLTLLDSEQLEELARNLFNFAELTDLETWLTSALGDAIVGKLTEKFENCSEELRDQVKGSSLEKLTSLGQALDELTTSQAVEQWLKGQQGSQE